MFDTPIDYQPINAPRARTRRRWDRPKGVVEDCARLRGRLETLETAASATDGLAMLKSNDLTASLKRIVGDLSDYYLIGYSSTNAKTDGSFRKIDVRVKRPGRRSCARGGAIAPPQPKKSPPAPQPSAPPDPAVTARERLLASLDRARTDRPVRFAGGYAWASAPDGEGRARPMLWVTAELDAAAARATEWSGGGRATLSVMTADGRLLWDEEAAVSPESQIIRPLPG